MPGPHALSATAAALLELVLAGGCAGCGADTPTLCGDCCEVLSGPARLAWPTPVPAGLPVPWAVTAYDGPARAALLAHKEDGRLSLSGPLGDALARSVLAAVGDAPRGGSAGRAPAVGLVPVPSRRAAVRARGHDPTLRLARRAARTVRRWGRDVEVLPVVRVARGLADQAGLDARERAANLDGALAVPDRLARLVDGRTVVVADDVITTGASINETTRVLRGAGADVVSAAVVAATRRRLPPGLCL